MPITPRHSDRRRRTSWAFALVAATLPVTTAAQDSPAPEPPPAPATPEHEAPTRPDPARPDPATDPALNDPGLDDRARELGGRPPAAPLPATETNAAEALAPVLVRGMDAATLGVPGAPLRREGTFLVRQRGSMVKLRTGDWVIAFQRDGKGLPERPMILVRSANLARMEQLGGTEPEAQTFVVTGQVFVYRGVNFLLPTIPPVLSRPEPGGGGRGEPGAPEPAKAEPGTAAGAASGDDPSTEELLRALEAQRDRPRGLGLARAPGEPTAPAGATGDGARKDRTPTILTEGTMLIRRRGRLVRTAGGDTALLFDTDADGSAPADPTMVLAPCLMLERMEQIALDRGESMVFEVSGRVLAYQGRNHIVPTMFQVYPPSELERRQ
ncbi:MAG: hypothetical protein ACKVU4_00875 [Phycisphaerales bacterium]